MSCSGEGKIRHIEDGHFVAECSRTSRKTETKEMAEIKKITDEDLAKNRSFIESIKYGSINIIIQDGKIVQIDKNEKIRI